MLILDMLMRYHPIVCTHTSYRYLSTLGILLVIDESIGMIEKIKNIRIECTVSMAVSFTGIDLRDVCCFITTYFCLHEVPKTFVSTSATTCRLMRMPTIRVDSTMSEFPF